jgi:hypothetical protein
VVLGQCFSLSTSVSPVSYPFTNAPCSYTMVLRPFYGTVPNPLLYSDLRAAPGKITTGTPDCHNYCENFIIYTLFTNVAAGRRLETHDLYQVTAIGPIRGHISTGTHLHPIPREYKGYRPMSCKLMTLYRVLCLQDGLNV